MVVPCLCTYIQTLALEPFHFLPGCIQWNLQIVDKLGTRILSCTHKVVPYKCTSVSITKQGANDLSIVGRLFTLRSVHYWRFCCNVYKFWCCV